MKKLLSFRAGLALGLAMSLLLLAAPARAEKRVALVIGNNDYKNVPKLQILLQKSVEADREA